MFTHSPPLIFGGRRQACAVNAQPDTGQWIYRNGQGKERKLAEDREPPPTRLSPWAEIIERVVEFTPGAKPDIYHAVSQTDYVAIVARTSDGTIPIVRQYRPALETFTWELPAGMLDKDEQPADCCRELLEETGFPAQKVHRSAVTRPARPGYQIKYIRSLSRPDRAPTRRQLNRHRTQTGFPW